MSDGHLPLPVLPLWLRLSLVAAVAAVIFYYSVWTVPPPEPITPGPITPPSPTPADDRFPDLVSLIEWRHITAYFALGVSLAYAFVTDTRPMLRKLALVVAVAFAYGVFIEVSQTVFTHRTFAVRDLGLNAVGIAASTGWYALERYARPVDVGARIRSFVRAQRTP